MWPILFGPPQPNTRRSQGENLLRVRCIRETFRTITLIRGNTGSRSVDRVTVGHRKWVRKRVAEGAIVTRPAAAIQQQARGISPRGIATGTEGSDLRSFASNHGAPG